MVGNKLKIGIVSLFVLFLVACGTGISDEELYNEAIDILETEFAQAYGFELEYSSIDMVEIEEMDDNLYEVRGNVYDQYQTGAEFTVKMSIDGDMINYEWMIE